MTDEPLREWGLKPPAPGWVFLGYPVKDRFQLLRRRSLWRLPGGSLIVMRADPWPFALSLAWKQPGCSLPIEVRGRMMAINQAHSDSRPPWRKGSDPRASKLCKVERILCRGQQFEDQYQSEWVESKASSLPLSDQRCKWQGGETVRTSNLNCSTIICALDASQSPIGNVKASDAGVASAFIFSIVCH